MSDGDFYLHFMGSYGILTMALPVNGKRLIPLVDRGALLAP